MPAACTRSAWARSINMMSIPFSVALTFNYHYDSDYNNNDNASFRRNPLEALAYFNGLGRFRIGGGMRYVYAARADLHHQRRDRKDHV